jgi:hypothetical protein
MHVYGGMGTLRLLRRLASATVVTLLYEDFYFRNTTEMFRDDLWGRGPQCGDIRIRQRIVDRVTRDLGTGRVMLGLRVSMVLGEARPSAARIRGYQPQGRA